MRIAKKAVANDTSRGASIPPPAYNLKQLYQFVTGRNLDNAHRAYDDVEATVQISSYKLFWDSRKENVFQFTESSPPTTTTVRTRTTMTQLLLVDQTIHHHHPPRRSRKRRKRIYPTNWEIDGRKRSITTLSPFPSKNFRST
jgi:hypothetical protein